MKFNKILGKIYVLILFLFFISILFFAKEFFLKQQKIITSPLPNFLTTLFNSQVHTLELWLPSLDDLKTLIIGLNKPDISANSALVYDLTNGKTLFEKNPKKRLPMASLTKIMTAIVALENKKDKYVVSKGSLVGEDSMGLSVGEVLTLRELLYGLILHSGNDAAETLASNYIWGREKFVEAMNDKASSFGLLDTHFTNPTGLEGDGKQYTTAYDLLVITRNALKFPLFAKVASTFDLDLPETSKHKAYHMENETNLLTTYPGVLGVKTGYTPEAGLCLVTYLEYNGHKIIGILLGSDNRRKEMKELLDYSLKIQGIIPPHS